jgi:hypothetical protein
MVIKKFFVSCLFLVVLCTSVISRADTLADANEIFDWAESEFPGLFPAGPSTTSLEPWIFRYYPSTDIFVAVNKASEDVYVLGGFWIEPTRIGSIEEVKRMAGLEEEEVVVVPTLRQGVYKPGTNEYVYGYGNAIENLVISGAPDDTDYTRWAMLHDGTAYRLYFFKKDSNDTLYQFAYNPASADYEYGYNSIATLKITNAPEDADTSSFAMLHDGSKYRLYLRSKTNSAKIHQFVFRSDLATYEYGYGNAIPAMDITGAPADTDFSRWAMLHDGSAYRLYAFQHGSDDDFYQFAYNSSTGDYEYGFNSIAEMSVEDMPETADSNSFAMLNDGPQYRFYFLDFER